MSKIENYVIRGVDKNRSFRVFIAKTTEMVEKARITHNLTPVATAALGRSITAGAIMGIMQKNEKDEVSMIIKGDGPLGEVAVVAKKNGNVKGYVGNPNIPVEINEQGKLDVGGAVGKGKLTVIRDYGLKEPYVGQADLISGEIAEDLSNYYVVSEQQPSAVALGVLVEKDLSVKAAGGMIIQVLPNISEDDLGLLEHKLQVMTPMSALIDEGYSPEEILEGLFEDMGIELLEKQEINYICDCDKERIERALISVGKAEIKDMIEKDHGAELTCHFCNTKYVFSESDLAKLIEKAEK